MSNRMCPDCRQTKRLQLCLLGCCGGICLDCRPRHFATRRTISLPKLDDSDKETKWLLVWTDCVSNLWQASVERFQRCREEVKAAYATIHEKLAQGEVNLLAALDASESSFLSQVQAANPIAELPTDLLSELIYRQCLNGTSEAPQFFDYHVTVSEENVNDCLETEFATVIPELNMMSNPGLLKTELERLREETLKLQFALAEAEKREATLNQNYQLLRTEYRQEQSELKAQTDTNAQLRSYCSQLQSQLNAYNQPPSNPQAPPFDLNHSNSFNNGPKAPLFPPLPNNPGQARFHPAFPSHFQLPQLPSPAQHRPDTASQAESQMERNGRFFRLNRL